MARTALPHHTKRRKANAEAIAFDVQQRGLAKEVAAELLKGTEVDLMLACGCEFTSDSYTPCREHRSNNAPRVCFCGVNEELYEQTKRACEPFNRYSKERTAALQRQRIEHFEECCHRAWKGRKAEETPEPVEDTELVRVEPAGSAGTMPGKAQPGNANGSSPSCALSPEEILRRLFDEEPEYA